MKIIITEKQAERVINNKIICEKCEHSWKKEDGDEHPFLCHTCGWDQQSKMYDKINLFDFWKNKLNVEPKGFKKRQNNIIPKFNKEKSNKI
jgi:hypothetical protein